MLERHELPALDLTDDEMAKSHVRYMVGGRAPRRKTRWSASSSRAPGRADEFLSNLRSDWNISLFHYRNHGSDFGRVLVGMQVPPADKGTPRRLPAAARLRLRGRDRQPCLPHVPVRELSPAGRRAGLQPPLRRGVRHPRLGHQPVHRAIELLRQACRARARPRNPRPPPRCAAPPACGRSSPAVAEAVAAIVEGIERDQHQFRLDRLAVRRWDAMAVERHRQRPASTREHHRRMALEHHRQGRHPPGAAAQPGLQPTGAGRLGAVGQQKASRRGCKRPTRSSRCRRLPRRGARDARQAGAHASPSACSRMRWRRAGIMGQGGETIFDMVWLAVKRRHHLA